MGTGHGLEDVGVDYLYLCLLSLAANYAWTWAKETLIGNLLPNGPMGFWPHPGTTREEGGGGVGGMVVLAIKGFREPL